MTRILLDPDLDLEDGGTGPVTLTATLLDPDPVAVQDIPVADAATVITLDAPAAGEAWRLTVRRHGYIVEERTTHFADVPTVAWAALTDVDPLTLQPSTSAVTAWQAVVAEVQAAADAVTPEVIADRVDAYTAGLLAAKADLIGGYVPTSQLPALSLNTGVMVPGRAAMLALTSGQVQPGDIAVDTSAGSTRGSYLLVGGDPAVLASWVLLNAPQDVVSSVNGQAGTVVLGPADVGALPANALPADLVTATKDADGAVTLYLNGQVL